MAAISSSDVSYVVNKIEKLEDGRKIVHATLSFGDGALTYPAGGVPVLKESLGCPRHLDSFSLFDKGSSGYEFSFDLANEKIRMFQSASQAAHSHSLLLKDAVVADGATSRVNADTNKLGANTGADITVAGGGANGGVQSGGSVSAAALSELSGTAIAAQAIKVVAIGY